MKAWTRVVEAFNLKDLNKAITDETITWTEQFNGLGYTMIDFSVVTQVTPLDVVYSDYFYTATLVFKCEKVGLSKKESEDLVNLVLKG